MVKIFFKLVKILTELSPNFGVQFFGHGV